MNKNCVRMVIIALVLGVIPLWGMKKVKFKKIPQNSFFKNKNIFDNKRLFSTKQKVDLSGFEKAERRISQNVFDEGGKAERAIKLDALIESEFEALHKAKPNASANDIVNTALKNAAKVYENQYIPIVAEKYWLEYKEDLPKEEYIQVLKDEFNTKKKWGERAIQQGSLQQKLGKKFGVLLGKSTGYSNLVLGDKVDIAERRISANVFDEGGRVERGIKLDALIESEFEALHKAKPNASSNDIILEAVNKAKKSYENEYIPANAQKYFMEYKDLDPAYYTRALKKELEQSLQWKRENIEKGVLQEKLSKKFNVRLGRIANPFASEQDNLKIAESRISANVFDEGGMVDRGIKLDALIESEFKKLYEKKPNGSLDSLAREAVHNAAELYKKEYIPGQVEKYEKEYNDLSFKYYKKALKKEVEKWLEWKRKEIPTGVLHNRLLSNEMERQRKQQVDLEKTMKKVSEQESKFYEKLNEDSKKQGKIRKMDEKKPNELQTNTSSAAQKLGFWQRMTQRVKGAFGYGK